MRAGPTTLGDEPTGWVRDGLLVVAQGIVDYADDLARSLDVGPPNTANSAHLVAAAWERWQAGAVDHLAGDFSFVLWDDRRGALFAYRSFPGPYPLFHSTGRSGEFSIVFASSIAGVLAHPGVSVELNRPAIAEAAGGLLFGEHGETCRRGVGVLNPGWALTQRNDASPQRFRGWTPAVDTRNRPRSEGADALLERIRAAVRTRLADDGPTAVWLSGGYDSSAVFAGAMGDADGEPSVDPSIVPVSIRYPEGDLAREDEWIEATAGRWGLTPRWLESTQIPLRDDLLEGADARDEPFVHLFDTWNQALAKTSREAGARIALGGDGGDQLFQAAPIHLADLARRLRPIGLVREYRRLGGRSAKGLMRWGLAPLLPRGLARVYEGFSGSPYPDTLRVAPPTWLARSFVRRHALLQRNREEVPSHVGRGRAAREVFRMASSPFFGRVATEVRRVARLEGVLHRSPLWDRHVVEFALSRPFAERVEGGESKILLRSALQGLVPDEVLAPRPQRTGAPDSVFHRLMRDGVLPTADRLGSMERLADLGIVEPQAFADAVSGYRAQPSFFLGAQIAFSVDTECWLRGLA